MFCGHSAGSYFDHKIMCLISGISNHPHGMSLDVVADVCTSVGCFCSWLHKWGMTPSADCECGTEEKNVKPVVLQCLIH